MRGNPMDFALFMERYGYKILLGIMAAVIIGLFAIPALGIATLIKTYGLGIGLVFLIVAAAYGFTVWRRSAEAYAKAHGKYFYDDKWYKRK
ncbi:hypothetical protein TSIB_1784 [Thermococcus sibiricus MM 739]|uniref:Uncharacterized protein n=2 Tax=Thermococcus sibiricus TaxID=172049 RepID=C6A5E0_THESM|nr:hypothetical protein TSIB_1784 [Thermococcus sibiricus MM 739]